ALSAIFRRLLGYRGLYVIPLAATWLLWWRFKRACADQAIAPGLAAGLLAFASPITLYSALFWDHTFALVLAFEGTRLLLLRRGGAAPGPGAAAAAGALVGVSGWFREELFFWGGLLAAVTIVGPWLRLDTIRPLKRTRAPFVVSLGA